MKLIRIIPSLLIKNNSLVKGEKFKSHKYIGDIFNAVKIFSEKGAHEIFLADIECRKINKIIDINLIKKIKSEIFVPLTVAGGINNLDQASKIIDEGVEKVCLNSTLQHGYKLVSEIACKFGSQSTVVSVDVKKYNDTYDVWFQNGTVKSNYILEEYLKILESEGAGEIILTSINNEGLRNGLDLNLYKKCENLVKIPLVANGGAGSLNDFEKIFDSTSITAVIGGSLFVYFGTRKAVLINYPDEKTLENIMKKYEV